MADIHKTKKEANIGNMALMASFVALTVVCSWIAIPFPLPFTLQTFAIFLSALVLGAGRSTLVILVYICMGLVGLPVFASFNSGPAAVLGPTGGYLIGFLFIPPLYALIGNLFGNKMFAKALGLFSGLLVCYTFGVLWFWKVYSETKGEIGLTAALMKGVIPFIIPDLTKILLSILIYRRISKFVNTKNGYLWTM